jgi:TatD DNase family protein
VSALVDAHCHLDFEAFDADRSGALERAERAGVSAVVVAAVDPDGSARARALRGTPGVAVHACAGLHPWWVDRLDDDALDAALARLEAELTGAEVAIGECGLDGVSVKRGGDAARQERALGAQLDLACARGLPVVLHAVRCHDRLLEILRARDRLPAFLMHGWSGPLHLMPHFAALGGAFSFGPRIAWEDQRKRRRALEWAAEHTPARWMIETDAPDGATARGARGEPAQLADVARAAAAALGLDVAEVADSTSRNTMSFFGV